MYINNRQQYGQTIECAPEAFHWPTISPTCTPYHLGYFSMAQDARSEVQIARLNGRQYSGSRPVASDNGHDVEAAVGAILRSCS
jgi:hypothetical protein